MSSILMGGSPKVNLQHKMRVMDCKNFYEKNYAYFQSSGLQANYIRLSHQLMEKTNHYYAKNILEIGGGAGEHVKFVKSVFETYILSDIRSIPKEVLLPEKVKFEAADAHKLPFANTHFDRIISTCVLHHLDNPRQALFEILRVWDKTGVVTILVPTDPHFLYVLSKKLFVNRKWRSRGILNPLDKHWDEHKNHFLAIDYKIKEVFSEYKVKKIAWPLHFVTIPGLNLFVVYQITPKN
jgi:ubiquinone/menaquinone biosynthesis C-methylase UbiE